MAYTPVSGGSGSGALGGDPHPPAKEEEVDPAAWAQSNLPATSAWSRGAATIINPKPKPVPVPPAPAPVAQPTPPAQPAAAQPSSPQPPIASPGGEESLAATPPLTPQQQAMGDASAPSPLAAPSPAAAQSSPSPVSRPPTAPAQASPEVSEAATLPSVPAPVAAAPGAQLHMQKPQQDEASKVTVGVVEDAFILRSECRLTVISVRPCETRTFEVTAFMHESRDC